MSLKLRNFFMENLSLVVLIAIPGVWSGNWMVITQSQCALRGTSFTIQCYYDYPYWQTVRTVQWFKECLVGDYWVRDTVPLHFKYVGDKKHNCALKINNIKQADEGFYFFLFTTNRDRWSSRRSFLSVRDLIANIDPTVVEEGRIVTLTCRSGCIMHSIESVWFREGQRVSQTPFTATRANAGRYACALQGQEHVRSASVTLNVQYAPNNVMLSISPSEDIIQGSAVSFTCSGEANPPVTPNGYRLFKDGHLIRSGPNHSISEVQPSDSGQYYCQASNNITWKGSNLFQSTETTINVLYPPMNISVSAELTEVLEGSDVNLTCHSNANPPDVGYTWYRRSSSIVQVGSGPLLSLSSVEASSSGLYMCQASNALGENNSTEVQLSVKSKYAGTFFPILAGIGMTLLMMFTLALLLYWKKSRNQDKTTGFSERESPSADEETQEPIYSNILMFQTPSSNDKADYSSSEEVFYTTVIVKPKKPSRKSRIQIAPEREDSVIYARVTKSC
ncbi:B-cell receptor CD22-like [Eucyclogobius newberryi]|uniref:B-cell receptor CD22-like n=1 Tax=Eucyclogobius newberryi TaxID=166745 RepID=UPI003B5C34C8